MKIKNILLVSVLLLLCGTLYSQNLVILHTNDTHSQIEPIRVGKGNGAGGIHRRAEYFNQVKAENENVLILDAGDYNQGTPYFTVFNGDLEIQLMNALGYEVVGIGNHEFDNGIEELARRLSKATFKTVCANYDFSGTPLEDLVEPYVIVNKGGKKIGIIGLTINVKTLVSAQNREGIVYNDVYDVANKLAKQLKNEDKCDLVIALTHIGYSAYPNQVSDISLAENTSNIDIIIGGHSHTFLKSERIYKNKAGENVVVLQAGAQGEYVGRLDLEF